MKKLPVCFWLLILLPFTALSQDEILLTLDNQQVMKSEFERIYLKNNNIQGFESKSARDYLELFINFKLKVHEAQMLGYDTLSSFRNELAGYREQLIKPYLQDRPLIDSLLREAYYRTVNELNASHIMVKLPANSSPADTLAAYSRIMDIRKRLLDGASFEKVAREESDDPSGKVNEGRLGWFSAFAMVLPFENAAYHLQVGEISFPVRSRYGYHIIRLNAKRQSLGEIKLAHIMIRAGRNDNPEVLSKAKDKIDNCYQLLQQGSLFADVVKQYSEDGGSSQSGGQMRWLRSGELPPDIEALVFALRDSGSYTVPVQSDYGWHIFKLEGKRPIAPFNQLKSQLEERLMADERGKLCEESFIAKVKKESGFISYPENISVLASLLDSSVYSGNWNVEIGGDLIEPVFSFGEKEYTQKNLVEYIVQTKRYRPGESIADIVDKKCTELINKELVAFEKEHLEEKYPDFRYLMEEYHDGILLFNIMDDKVWNKAVSDTTGLRAFHAQHVKDYMWQERADVSVYSLNDDSYLKLTRKLAKKRIKKNWTAGEITKMICRNDTVVCVEVADHTYEKGDPLPSGGFAWKKGFLKVSQEKGKTKIIFVNQVLPPMPKLFQEIRGQVTADYQNYLDQEWIRMLRMKYPVVVNNAVLRRIQ